MMHASNMQRKQASLERWLQPQSQCALQRSGVFPEQYVGGSVRATDALHEHLEGQPQLHDPHHLPQLHQQDPQRQQGPSKETQELSADPIPDQMALLGGRRRRRKQYMYVIQGQTQEGRTQEAEQEQEHKEVDLECKVPPLHLVNVTSDLAAVTTWRTFTPQRCSGGGNDVTGAGADDEQEADLRPLEAPTIAIMPTKLLQKDQLVFLCARCQVYVEGILIPRHGSEMAAKQHAAKFEKQHVVFAVARVRSVREDQRRCAQLSNGKASKSRSYLVELDPGSIRWIEAPRKQLEDDLGFRVGAAVDRCVIERYKQDVGASRVFLKYHANVLELLTRPQREHSEDAYSLPHVPKTTLTSNPVSVGDSPRRARSADTPARPIRTRGGMAAQEAATPTAIAAPAAAGMSVAPSNAPGGGGEAAAPHGAIGRDDGAAPRTPVTVHSGPRSPVPDPGAATTATAAVPDAAPPAIVEGGLSGGRARPGQGGTDGEGQDEQYQFRRRRSRLKRMNGEHVLHVSGLGNGDGESMQKRQRIASDGGGDGTAAAVGDGGGGAFTDAGGQAISGGARVQPGSRVFPDTVPPQRPLVVVTKQEELEMPETLRRLEQQLAEERAARKAAQREAGRQAALRQDAEQQSAMREEAGKRLLETQRRLLETEQRLAERERQLVEERAAREAVQRESEQQAAQRHEAQRQLLEAEQRLAEMRREADMKEQQRLRNKAAEAALIACINHGLEERLRYLEE